jgi:hypothetical protein
MCLRRRRIETVRRGTVYLRRRIEIVDARRLFHSFTVWNFLIWTPHSLHLSGLNLFYKELVLKESL